MTLADRIAQCQNPFMVRHASGSVSRLNGAADFSQHIVRCPTRYVLSDDLTRLCTAIAYSKGARTLACADLLHVPAPITWVEWCEAPWRAELKLYGFQPPAADSAVCGRRGAFIQSSADGRRGLLRTFWSGESGSSDTMVSSMEAYFDFDTPSGEDPPPFDGRYRPTVTVSDGTGGDLLQQCVRFRYEASWDDYYGHARCTPEARHAIARHVLGTIAIDIPVLLAFLLLLGTRSDLSHRPHSFERLNRRRMSCKKAPLLDHIEVHSPILQTCRSPSSGGAAMNGSPRRLHHVRGHLVRRGSQVFWRVPHLRGNARCGSVRSRTVTWCVADDKLVDGTRVTGRPSYTAQH